MSHENLILRPPRAEDVLPYTAFLADREVSLWLDERAQRPISPATVESILFTEAWCLWSLDVDGVFVGVASLYEPDLSRGVARFSIVIGDKRYWGRGIGTTVLGQVLEHAFKGLGLRKVNSDYLAPHEASRRIHVHHGFVGEGVLREDAWRQGRWVDRELVSLLRTEYSPGAPA